MIVLILACVDADPANIEPTTPSPLTVERVWHEALGDFYRMTDTETGVVCYTTTGREQIVCFTTTGREQIVCFTADEVTR